MSNIDLQKTSNPTITIAPSLDRKSLATANISMGLASLQDSVFSATDSVPYDDATLDVYLKSGICSSAGGLKNV